VEILMNSGNCSCNLPVSGGSSGEILGKKSLKNDLRDHGTSTRYLETFNTALGPTK